MGWFKRNNWPCKMGHKNPVVGCSGCIEIMKVYDATSPDGSLRCPQCGSTKVTPCSAATHTGKLAGAILFGLAGVVAGAVIDGVHDKVKQSVQGKECQCASCGHRWVVP
jgi:DNA-directed RNA polymerase subunit RPC12/RpoP